MNVRKTNDETRPPQFSLRTLFVVMTVAALWFASGVLWGAFGMVVAGLFLLGMMLFKSREWLGAVLILMSGVMLLFEPAFNDNRTPGRRNQCSNNLKQIAIALHVYHEQYGSFPPAYIADAQGWPMHSWRVLILPDVEEGAIYKQYRFDEPWNGPNNSKLHGHSVPNFLCPSDSKSAPTSTNYVAIVGPGTMWPGEQTTTFDDIKDGASWTLMVVEIPNSGIHWMEPRDLDVRFLATVLRANPGHDSRGSCAVFADGSGQFIDNKTAADKLEAMATIAGGEKIDSMETP